MNPAPRLNRQRSRPPRPGRVSASSVTPLVAGAAGFGLVIAAALLRGSPGGDAGTGSPPERNDDTHASPPQATAPTVEVQRVHDALHDIAARCPPGGRSLAPAQKELEYDLDLVLAFAKQYANIQVTLDDESGSSLSLLIATRADLRGCAPAQAARLNAAIPAEFRDGPCAVSPADAQTRCWPGNRSPSSA